MQTKTKPKEERATQTEERGRLRTMGGLVWNLKAVSPPFSFAGTAEHASLHSTTIPSPRQSNYFFNELSKWTNPAEVFGYIKGFVSFMIFIYWCGQRVWICHCICVQQKTTFKSQFFPSSIRVTELRLRSSSIAAAFTCWPLTNAELILMFNFNNSYSLEVYLL